MDNKSVSDVVREITISEHAQLSYTIDDTVLTNSGNCRFRFFCKAQSKLAVNLLVVGGTDLNIFIELILQGTGAHAQLFGNYAVGGHDKIAIAITQKHVAPHAISYSMVKGAAAGEAQVKYNGMVYTAVDASGTDAALYNKNILVSGDARITAIPSLEVLTNDVHCKHGTATGRIDEEQLLYMQSRGIAKQRATYVCLQGFFADGGHVAAHESQRLMQCIMPD